MKTFSLVVFAVFATVILSAQSTSPIPKISQQLTDYFNYYPKEKVFVSTDKSIYKPGETLWFKAFVTNANNQPTTDESHDLFVKLYDIKGTPIIQEVFRLVKGSASGDLQIPETISKDSYFLVAYTNTLNVPEEISVIQLAIDPAYSNNWSISSTAKDSVSISGQKNELSLVLQDVSGDIQKNTSLRYQLLNGTEIIEKEKIKTDANGKVIIPFTLPSKTSGEPFVIELINNRDDWKKSIFLPSNLDPIVIQFFPEGGNLVAGTPVKIGFTAFNKWGIPVDIDGSVVDLSGKTITQAKTFTKGLGLFSMVCDAKQKYKLVISGKTGQKQSFELPAPKPDGLALSVVKSENEFITANLIFADNQKHSVALTMTRANNLNWAADLDINGMGKVKIPCENLSDGINLLSAFSGDGQLLAKRIIFIDKKSPLKLQIQPEKSVLKPNESMTVKVRLLDAKNQLVSGNLTIAVTDKIGVKPDQEKIDEYLLMESELTTPISLISGALSEKTNHSALMDIFMIANQIKGAEWSKINAFNREKINENSNFTGLSGIVTDKNGTKISKAKVSLVNNKNMKLHTTTTNSSGFFTFQNLTTVNEDDFSAKATDPEGKRELIITFNKNFEAQISDFIVAYAQKYSLLNNDFVVDEAYFKTNQELFPKAPRITKTNTIAIDNQRKLLSNSTNLMDVIKSIKPYKIMNNQIVFMGSENSINYQGGALLVLDGQQMGTDISAISNISPMEVDHINISTNPMDIQRYTGLNSVGVIEIFQKRAQISEPESKKQTNNQYDGRYRIANVFQAEPINPKRNNRTTLQWIPELPVDETGTAEFTLTASKIISDFVIDIQGISTDGRPVSAKAYFSVVK